MLMWLHFASSIFGGSASIFKFELYFGLLIFVGYMVADTQEIIEKAHLGDMDYEKHSLTLFTDFVAVFIRILIIMAKEKSGYCMKQQQTNLIEMDGLVCRMVQVTNVAQAQSLVLLAIDMTVVAVAVTGFAKKEAASKAT
ncbi:hypothetical protein YC2023_074458 [Brassica napus]